MKLLSIITFSIFLMVGCSSSVEEPTPNLDIASKSNIKCKGKARNIGCLAIYDPVCGCDGKTYGNSCEAYRAGLSSWTEGPCQQGW